MAIPPTIKIMGILATRFMTYKLIVRTPPQQAHKAMESSKKVFLGKLRERVVAESLLAHDKFCWVLVLSPDEEPKLIERCAKGEVLIRQFYKKLFKELDRSNKLAHRLGKSMRWIKARVKKMMNKGKGSEGFDEELDWMNIEDRAEIESFLEGDMIKIEEVKNENTGSIRKVMEEL